MQLRREIARAVEAIRLGIGAGLALWLTGCLPAVDPVVDPLAMPRTAPNLFWNMARVPLPGPDRLLIWKAAGGLADLDGFRLESDRLVATLSAQPMVAPSAWPNPASGGLSHSAVREGPHGAGQFARHLYRRSTRQPGLDVRPNPSETLSIIWTDASLATLSEVQHGHYIEGPDVSEDFPPGSLSLKRSKVRRSDGGYDDTITVDRLDYNAPGTEASWLGRMALTTSHRATSRGAAASPAGRGSARHPAMWRSSGPAIRASMRPNWPSGPVPSGPT
jgi:hypothetical protein